MKTVPMYFHTRIHTKPRARAEQAEFRTADVPVQDLLPVRDTSVADIPDSDTPDHCTHSGNRSDCSVPCAHSFWSSLPERNGKNICKSRAYENPNPYWKKRD